uniref:GpsA protein n=1 Tax=Fopius arisanus TaxID=64838 RepID=A0A0C9R0B6_9HYME
MWCLHLIIFCASLVVTAGELVPGVPPAIGEPPYLPGQLKPDEMCRLHYKDKGAHMVKDPELVGDLICIIKLPCKLSSGVVKEMPGTPRNYVICDKGMICKDGKCQSWRLSTK